MNPVFLEEEAGWLEKRGEVLSKLGKSIVSNVGTILIFIGIIVLIILAAYFSQKLIDRKKGIDSKSEKIKVNRITIIAMFSAIAVILNLFSIPLGFAPSFYKADLSELPVIIGTFTLGPAVGVTIETVKILLNILINGTSTAFVGEIANFAMGCAYVVPAGIIYYYRKTRRNAAVGLIAGVIIGVVAGAFLNAFLLLPVYAKVFHLPIEELIAKGTEKNSLISGMTTFILLAVVPFNLIKYGAVSLITMLIYKPVSRILKGSGTGTSTARKAREA